MAAEAILVNGVTEILKKMSFFLAEEISLAWGVKDELRNMKKTLDMILAVMVDAEKKQVHSKSVRLWLEELKDIAYEAEDLLDDCSYQVIHQHQLTRKKDKVCNFFSSSNPIVFRLKIAHEIKNINKKFNDVAKRKENLGLQIIELGMTSRTLNVDESSKIRETDSIIDKSLRIVGRDDDKSNIINELLHHDPNNQNENIHVIPIVGMGGLGKTTLAQLIYNDDKVKKHFELKMWVCVSDDFDVKKLFMKIIESITGNKCDDVSNIEVITRKLEQYLSGKKYLLVLDDVWNKKREEWVRLKKPLLVGGNGSKILVTTRSDTVASIMGGELHSYKLDILNEDESWSLFKEITFGYVGGAVETPTLTTIGKELVKKCGGLPLAIIFLGSLLRSKEEIEWNVVKQNQIWDQYSDEDESKILPIIKLSYDHLPSHLKQCFSYFSLFSKDCTFSRKKMILLWMVEGFIIQRPSGKNNKSMEEVGNEYFNSLLYNSFFQDVERDVFGQVFSFKMHDLVHDLAKDVANDRECLFFTVHENMETIPNVGRLRLHDFNEGMSKTVCKALQQDKMKLRTLLCDGTVENVENAFDGLKRLRSLDLSEVRNFREIPWYLMGNLKHLRYLNLSDTKIVNLPKSVMRLYHLQTLNLDGCENLKELPKGIEKLINLRYLYLPRHMNFPRAIGQLSGLQTLNRFNVGIESTGSGGRGCGIQVLERLNLLDDALIINHLRNVTSGIHAQQAHLKSKKNLNQIMLNWHTEHVAREEDNDDDNGDEDEEEEEEEEEAAEEKEAEAVLEGLQPHPNLKLLVINHYSGVSLPWWMGDPSCLPNLVILQLNKCTKCEQLVWFGKLPSLKVLQFLNMDGIKCLGNEFYDNSSGGGGGVVLFPSLKTLGLANMSCLEEWVDIPSPTPTVGVSSYSSCFPCLDEILIYSCPNLRIMPTGFPSLKQLSLKEINEKIAVPLITTNLVDSLCEVELRNISELTFLPYCLLQDLEVLNVISCLDFQGFYLNEEEKEAEEEEFSIISLTLLGLPNLKFLPDIRSFTSIEGLIIGDCESFKPLPEDVTCLPASLEHLKWVEIRNVKEVKDFRWEK